MAEGLSNQQKSLLNGDFSGKVEQGGLRATTGSNGVRIDSGMLVECGTSGLG